MATDVWQVGQLTGSAPVALGGACSPLAHVTPMTAFGTVEGSGFLVHPRILVTAAHVATFPTDKGPGIPAWIAVELGAVVSRPSQVAVLEAWMQGATTDVFNDLAVLAFAEPVCSPQQVGQLMTSVPVPGTQYAARVCGAPGGNRNSVNVNATCAQNEITYPCSDLHGDSGGPVMSDQALSFDQNAALGLHIQWINGVGQAVPLDPARVLAAIAALGVSV